MIATANTLNGMTVEQLRDLAARAEATAKQKEAKSTYVELGRGVDGLEWRFNLATKQFETLLSAGNMWTSLYTDLAQIVGPRGIADLKYIQFLITRYIDLKERGLIK